MIGMMSFRVGYVIIIILCGTPKGGTSQLECWNGALHGVEGMGQDPCTCCHLY